MQKLRGRTSTRTRLESQCRPDPSSRSICAAIPAERGQVFAARFVKNPAGQVTRIGKIDILANEAWLAELSPGDLVTGPALEKLAGSLPQHVLVADPTLWHPIASTVGNLAWNDYKRGRREDVWELVPQYHRLSAAEEKLKGRG